MTSACRPSASLFVLFSNQSMFLPQNTHAFANFIAKLGEMQRAREGKPVEDVDRPQRPVSVLLHHVELRHELQCRV